MQGTEGLESEKSKACLLLRVPHRRRCSSNFHACSMTRPAADQLTSQGSRREVEPVSVQLFKRVCFIIF